VSSLLFMPKVLLHCWQLNSLRVVFWTAGTFCSIAFADFALSPVCSFLKVQKKTFLNKRTVSQASNVVWVCFRCSSRKFFTTRW
jgi:hypothetical protein